MLCWLLEAARGWLANCSWWDRINHQTYTMRSYEINKCTVNQGIHIMWTDPNKSKKTQSTPKPTTPFCDSLRLVISCFLLCQATSSEYLVALLCQGFQVRTARTLLKRRSLGEPLGNPRILLILERSVWLKDFTLTQHWIHWMLYTACGWRLWGDSKTELWCLGTGNTPLPAAWAFEMSICIKNIWDIRSQKPQNWVAHLVPIT